MAPALLATVALLVAGCGSGGGDDDDTATGMPTTTSAAAAAEGDGASDGGETAPVAAGTAPAGSASGTAGGSGGEGDGDGAGKPAPDAATTPTSKVERTPGFAFEGSVRPGCAAPGEFVTVTVKTTPRASTASAVSYADQEAHGAYTVGEADRDGVWTWQLLVAPDVPEGWATVLVSAQQRTWTEDGEAASTTGETANARYPLEISRSC